MAIDARAGKAIEAPEPGLTPAAMIERAVAMRELLKERAAETEQRSHPTDDIHQACLDAGFYRCYVPRRYGGYAFGAPTFMRVIQELARGDVGAAWCIALASAHALQVASWWPEQAQEEIFGDGDFRAAAVAAPIGPATHGDGEWALNGRVAYCSGIPLSTHYMGQALIAGADGTPTERMLLFVAPRSAFEILDDWGRLAGLKGSGSNSITFTDGRIPEHWAIEDALMVDFDVAGRGAPGVALHGDPMYGGRAMSTFTLTLTALAIGGAYAALDEYEEMLHTKMTPLPPIRPRIEDETFHRWYGSAPGKDRNRGGGALQRRRPARRGLPSLRRGRHPLRLRRGHADRLHRPRGDDPDLGDRPERDLPHRRLERDTRRQPFRAHLSRPLDDQQPPQHRASRLRLRRAGARRSGCRESAAATCSCPSPPGERHCSSISAVRSRSRMSSCAPRKPTRSSCAPRPPRSASPMSSPARVT